MVAIKQAFNPPTVSLVHVIQAFTGDRYGYCPIPVEIGVDRFDEILAVVMADGAGDKDILTMWYRRDDNAVPPVYVLQVQLFAVVSC